MFNIPTSSHNNKRPGFRADVNFLRALAVIVVVLFHFKIELFSGGYVGVDVFFVISGFLMTRIIVTGLDSGHFSIMRFYLARGKRIIPALAVLCLVLSVLGWFFLLPSEYRLLAKHLSASITFLSNYIYIGEAGYFDPTSDQKWLLHTWSLSVEWQFYIIFPLTLLIVNKILSARYFRLLLLFLALVSFGYMVYLGNIGGKSLYFGLMGRVWEMVAGGLVYLFPVVVNQRLKRCLFYLGLSFILASAFFFDHSLTWPGFWTFFPVLGTMMVIYAGDNEHKLVSNPLVRIIGTASYSIYLWHWPIVTAFTVFSFGFSPVSITVGIGLSLVLGGLSYLFIEKTTANIKGGLYRQLGLLSAWSMLVFTFGGVIFLNNGFSQAKRFSQPVITADQEYLNREPRKNSCLLANVMQSPHCIYGNKDLPVVVILFGDSHASSIVTAVAKAVADQGSLLFIAQPGCLTVLSNYRLGKNNDTCSDFVANEIDYIKEHYANTPVLVVNRWSYYLKGKVGKDMPLVSFGEPADSSATISRQFETNLIETMCLLSESNPSFLMKPIPEFEYELPKQAARLLINGEEGDISLAKSRYMKRNDKVLPALELAAAKCGVSLLDPTDFLCENQQCRGAVKGRPLYYDDNHLSESGNLYLLPLFKF